MVDEETSVFGGAEIKKKNDTENDDQSHAARGREGLKC